MVGEVQKVKSAYRPPASELPGVKTWVSPKKDKGINEDTNSTVENDYIIRPSVPERKQQALPITPEFKKEREKHQPYPDQPSGRPSYNGPGPSGTGPDEKSVHKDKARTQSKPGEEYGHPWKDDGYGVHRRVEVTASAVVDRYAGLYNMFPSGPDRQHRQYGLSKSYSARYYRKNKGILNNKAKKRYRRVKTKSNFHRDVRLRREYPVRFKRLPSGSYGRPEDRSKDWREETKSKVAALANPIYFTVGEDEDGTGIIYDVTLDGVAFEYDGGLFETDLESFLAQDVLFEDVSEADRFLGMLEATYGGEDVSSPKVAEKINPYMERKRPSDRLQSGESQESGTPKGEDENAQSYSGLSTWVVPMTHAPGFTEHRDQQSPAEIPDYGQVDSNPGSTRVIPSGHDFVNKEAAKISDILESTGRKIHRRVPSIRVQQTRTMPGQDMWHFTVQDPKSDQSHRVRLKALREGNVRDLSKCDVQVECDCEFFRWYGPEYWADQEGYLYGRMSGDGSFPEIRDPKGLNRACKHILAVLKYLAARKVWLQPRPQEKVGCLHYQADMDGVGRLAIGAMMADKRGPCGEKYKKEDGQFKGEKGERFENCKKFMQECRDDVDNPEALCAWIGRSTGKIGSLRTQLIHLAHDIPALRATLVPLLRDADEST